MAAVGTATKAEAIKDEKQGNENMNQNANPNLNHGNDSNRGRGGGPGGRGRGGGRGRDFRGGGRGGRGGAGGNNSRFDNSGDQQQHRRENNAGNNEQNNRSSGDWNNRRDQQNNSDMQEIEDLSDVVEAKKEMKKFTGRCRLFVGNLSNDVDEEAFKLMFTEYGEISEVYLSKGKGFGFIRLDTRMNAQAAKDALDGSVRKGREIRVRFATHGAALKVKHLPPNVSNELLEEAFAKFGEIERAIVVVDDRGRSTGEGVVEFARKPGASKALQAITDGVLLLTSSPRPIIVEPLDQTDGEDGLQERYMSKNHQFMKDREQGPRFAPPGSFEYEFGQRWKQLYEMEAKEKERLKKEMEDAIEKLEMEMTNALHDHTANKLREELRRIEELKAQDERRRMEMLARRQEEERVRQEQEERRRQEQLLRSQQQEEMMRRRQQYRHDDLMMIDTGIGGGGLGGNRGGRGDFGNNDRRNNRDNSQADRESNQGELDNSGASPMQPPPKPPVGLGVDQLQDGQLPNAQSQMRQTRFDQPPNSNFGSMMGGQNRDLMRERMMERRENRPREEYIDQKRSRRF